MREGYHEHQYSEENQEAAFEFLDHFNGMPSRHTLAPVKELDEKTLQCTRSGQVMLDHEDARSAMDEIRDYYQERKDAPHQGLKELYFSSLHPAITSWTVVEYKGTTPGATTIEWQSLGSTQFGNINVDRYLLRHSRYLQMPLLWIHRKEQRGRKALLWLGENGKTTSQAWPELAKLLNSGYDIVSFDPRGLGETRMPYKAVSPDDPALAQMTFDQAYVSPLSGVLADYVYNSVLTGRPYFFQMMEDVEIAARFSRVKLNPGAEITIAGIGNGFSLASAAAEVLPATKVLPQDSEKAVKWSELVDQKRELWPIEFLLPSGAYIH
jgi:hypothetical protein